MKPQYKDDLFPYLNWILRKTSSTPDSAPSIFITNRWLSMVDKNVCNVINTTFNRWIFKTTLSRDPMMAGKFYKTVLPKISKRINYIKKTAKESDNNKDDLKNLANALEISERELKEYNNLLQKL